MEEMRFVCPGDGEREDFTRLVMQYADEMNAHTPHPLPKAYQPKWAAEMLAAPREGVRRLEMCYAGKEAVGFCYGRVDDGTELHPGWGCMLECYVQPAFRQKGAGALLTQRMEAWFREQDVPCIYLTAEPVSGLPFWQRMGYVPNGEIMAFHAWPVLVKK